MIKVGTDVIFNQKKGKELTSTYADVKCDKDGWVDTNEYLPIDFDLVYLKVLNENKILSGWSTGISWDGLNLKPESKILYWKRYE